MPAGAARRGDPGRARPARLFRLRRLPQDEIHRIALVRGDVDARARQHLVERAVRERAIARRARQRVHGRGREEDMVLGDIGDAAGDEPLDHRAHPLDMLSGARLEGRRQGAQRRDVFAELALGRFRHLGDRVVEWQVRPVALGAGVDLVVDVGDVADVDYMLGPVDMAEQAEQHVEHDRPAARCRYGRSRRPSGRRHRGAPRSGRSARNPPSGGSACCGSAASSNRLVGVGLDGATRAPSGTGRVIASRRCFRNRDANQPA